MRVDPHREALRLLQGVDRDLRGDLAEDPRTVVELLVDRLTISTRPPSPTGKGCAVDGTYRPGPPPRITVAADVSLARQRFTILHEYGHHLIENDASLNEDLDLSSDQRRDEEICNEVAAAVLLPGDDVDAALPAGRFTAHDVANLYEVMSASRMACCVAAARRLRRPGCVILGQGDGRADFVAHHPSTPWRIARGTPQGPESILARAADSSGGSVREVTTVRFASGNSSGDVHGDAYVCSDGWVFAVIVDDTHAPWGEGLHIGLVDTGPEAEEVECFHCGEVTRVCERPCPACGDRRCRSCGRCSCDAEPDRKGCEVCRMFKLPSLFPGGGTICVDCQD